MIDALRDVFCKAEPGAVKAGRLGPVAPRVAWWKAHAPAVERAIAQALGGDHYAVGGDRPAVGARVVVPTADGAVTGTVVWVGARGAEHWLAQVAPDAAHKDGRVYVIESWATSWRLA